MIIFSTSICTKVMSNEYTKYVKVNSVYCNVITNVQMYLVYFKTKTMSCFKTIRQTMKFVI